MKLCVKRIYCSCCRRSVRAREECGDGQDRVICGKCGRTIRIGNGIYWRLPKEGESVTRRLAESRPVRARQKTAISNVRTPAGNARTAGGRSRTR